MSVVLPPGYDHPVGLAYIKHRELESEAQLAVGAADAASAARVVELPFTTQDS